jgi:hypothetical protein
MEKPAYGTLAQRKSIVLQTLENWNNEVKKKRICSFSKKKKKRKEKKHAGELQYTQENFKSDFSKPSKHSELNSDKKHMVLFFFQKKKFKFQKQITYMMYLSSFKKKPPKLAHFPSLWTHLE